MSAPSGQQGLESCSQRGTGNILHPLCWSLQPILLCDMTASVDITQTALATKARSLDMAHWPLFANKWTKSNRIAQEKYFCSCCSFNEEIMAMDSITNISSQSE